MLQVANGAMYASASPTSLIPVVIYSGVYPSQTVKTALEISGISGNTLTVNGVVAGYSDLPILSGTNVQNWNIPNYQNNLAEAYSNIDQSQIVGLTAALAAKSPLAGSSSIVTVGTVTTGVWNATKIGVAYGGTNADLSGTGGTGQVLKQTTSGGNVSVAALTSSDIPNIAESQVTNLTTDLAAKSPLAGSSSIVTVGTVTTGVWNATKIGVAYGGTNADLSATGGTGQVLKQTSSGGAISVAAISASDLPSITSTGSTTARSLPSRFAEVFNVKDYGAVGDGSTDDTTAIQAAITAAQTAGGGTIYFPSATYVINSLNASGNSGNNQYSLTFGAFSGGAKFYKFVGNGSTITTSLNTNNASVITSLFNISGTLRDLVFEGIRFVNTHSTTLGPTVCLNLSGGSSNVIVNTTIRNCVFTDFAQAIRLSGMVNTRIINNEFLSDSGRDSGTTTGTNPNVSIWAFCNANGTCANTTIQGNYFNGCVSGNVSSNTGLAKGLDGFIYGQSAGWNITGNTIRNHGVESIFVWGRLSYANPGTSYPVVISNNTIDSTPVTGTSGTPSYSIRCEESGVVISDNTITGSTRGVFVNGGDTTTYPSAGISISDISIANNRILMASTSDFGINVSNVTRGVISGNAITWTSYSAINSTLPGVSLTNCNDIQVANNQIVCYSATATVTATLAQINAGLTLISGVTGQYITVTGFSAVVSGNFASGTAVILQSTNATPLVVATLAEAGLTNGTTLTAGGSNVTNGAGLGFALGSGDGLQVVNSGSAQTGGTSITFTITYKQAAQTFQGVYISNGTGFTIAGNYVENADTSMVFVNSPTVEVINHKTVNCLTQSSGSRSNVLQRLQTLQFLPQSGAPGSNVYNIISNSVSGYIRGKVKIACFIDNQRTFTDFQFVGSGFGIGSNVTQASHAINGRFTQAICRGDSSGTGNMFVDLVPQTITTPAPVTLTLETEQAGLFLNDPPTFGTYSQNAPATLSFGQGLASSAGVTQTLTTISSNATLNYGVSNVKVDATSGNVTITLRNANNYSAGQMVTIYRTDSTSNTVTIQTTSSQVIMPMNVTSFTLSGGETAWLVSSGSSQFNRIGFFVSGLATSGGTGVVLKQASTGSVITSAALSAADIPTIAQSQVTSLTTALASKQQSLLMASGNYYFLGQCTNVGTSNTLGNTSCRSIPVYFTNNVTLSRIGAEITSAGNAGSLLRLGIYNDNGSGYPGSLLIDAGTIDGTSVAVQEITISQAVTAGLYWLCATVQGAATTQPTVRTASGIPGWYGGTTTPTSSAFFVGFSQTAAGALPANFNSTVALHGQMARVFVKIA